LLFILIGTIVGYGYFLKEKNSEYAKIEQGFCPKCKFKSIELIDIRGAGCGPKIVTFRCNHCGYENSYTQKGGGSCSI
jgi:RNase P subunit RPR2